MSTLGKILYAIRDDRMNSVTVLYNDEKLGGGIIVENGKEECYIFKPETIDKMMELIEEMRKKGEKI